MPGKLWRTILSSLTLMSRKTDLWQDRGNSFAGDWLSKCAMGSFQYRAPHYFLGEKSKNKHHLRERMAAWVAEAEWCVFKVKGDDDSPFHLSGSL